MRDKLGALKPYLVGALIGAVAVPVIGVWRGDLVTAGTATSRIETATVETRAAFCEALARQHHAEEGGIDLVGVQQRQRRDDLAARFAVMPGETAANATVRRACANRLARAV